MRPVITIFLVQGLRTWERRHPWRQRAGRPHSQEDCVSPAFSNPGSEYANCLHRLTAPDQYHSGADLWRSSAGCLPGVSACQRSSVSPRRVAIGPFTPGFVGDIQTIMQLAEWGDLPDVRRRPAFFLSRPLACARYCHPWCADPDGAGHAAWLWLSQLWGWDVIAGVMLGLAISVASTVVLLRGLMDNSLLNTSHGQAAVGWLVMEDIMSVLILVLMPTMAAVRAVFDWQIAGDHAVESSRLCCSHVFRRLHGSFPG